ncbi:hypothetical protein H0H81_010319 [Sphagnurus paluster]|uniref:Enoyl reductase (ER) domain-containing protein n=1 Tax=Sphagnurus paluster TaxID=117069 RepID=A0A9P7K5D2_9AGAR|nr:hypothetical protein H0H81_010319 [Sphagnurus paluster]
MAGNQKALYLQSKQGSFEIVENVDIPKPGAGQLLVRIQASGLNPVDWKIQKYGAWIENYPAILGSDIAGVVEALGDDVSGFATGDRVQVLLTTRRDHIELTKLRRFFQGGWTNETSGFQQYTLANHKLVSKIPANITTDEAATIPVAIAAAAVGLYLSKPYGAGLTAPLDSESLGKDAGKPIVIIGGATSVGQCVIQLAKLSRFFPIIVTASLKHEEYLKSLGATHVLDRNLSTSALAGEIGKITAAPIAVVYDSVSLPGTQQTGYDLLAQGGVLALVLERAPEVKLVEGKDVISAFGFFNQPHSRDLGFKLYASLEQLLAQGTLKGLTDWDQPNRLEVVPGGLDGVVSGLQRLQNDQVSGVKLVVHPQETA